MKKLIIVLMMVAMASFLFVGCLSGTTTPDTTTDTTTDTTPPPVVTKAPIITAVGGVVMTSTAAQYVNKGESNTAAGIVVTGTAPTYSEVKVYLNGKVAGTSDTTWAGIWSLNVTLTELGNDGAKALYAISKAPGEDESVKSNEVKFTLDRTLPKMTSVAAYPDVPIVGDGHYKVGFSEDIDISVDVLANTASALNPVNWSVTMGAGGNTGFLVASSLFTAVSTKVIQIVPDVVGATLVLATGASYAIYCWDIEDVAGNIIATAPVAPAFSTAVIYGITL